jgi:DNA helicase-2/ATP-dependent DNA helicase PcrA
MDMLEGLNEEQAAAVRHKDGPMLVVAGAGTGKTRVITHRIAWLLQDESLKPSQVLALTFTEKAAREMEERLHELIGWRSFQVPVMTFNAFGAELLLRFASHIGRSVRGGLINETQKLLLLAQHIGDAQFKYYGPQSDMLDFLEGVVSYIGNLQNAGVTPEKYEEYAKALTKDASVHPREADEQCDLAMLYRMYEDAKLKSATYFLID